jgi:hypothetical protein
MHVQPQRKEVLFESTAKFAVAATLALLLITSAALSVSHALHQKLHPDSSASAHSCLVCSLSKGQVNSAAAAPILAVFVSSLFFFIPAVRSVRLPAADRRLSLNRGPPSVSLSRRIVG